LAPHSIFQAKVGAMLLTRKIYAIAGAKLTFARIFVWLVLRGYKHHSTCIHFFKDLFGETGTGP